MLSLDSCVCQSKIHVIYVIYDLYDIYDIWHLTSMYVSIWVSKEAVAAQECSQPSWILVKQGCDEDEEDADPQHVAAKVEQGMDVDTHYLAFDVEQGEEI